MSDDAGELADGPADVTVSAPTTIDAGSTAIVTAKLVNDGDFALGQAQFTLNLPSGWTASGPGPVTIAAGTTYVASYHTTVGKYAVNVSAFAATGVTSGPLHIPVGGAVYKYGTGGFPTSPANRSCW